MKEYECRTLYPANETSGRLVVIDFSYRPFSENEIDLDISGLISRKRERLKQKDGWKDNPYNLIGKYDNSNIYFFEELKNEDLIILMGQNITIDSSHLRENSVKGIITDYDKVFYENPFHSSSRHALIYAREAGIPIVGMKNATDYLIPGQKITIKPRVPVGIIVVEP